MTGLFINSQNEIKGAEQKLEESQTENHHIKEINNDLKARLESAETRLAKALKAGTPESKNGECMTQDINTILKLSSRLQDMINYNKTLKEENDTCKQVCQSFICGLLSWCCHHLLGSSL